MNGLSFKIKNRLLLLAFILLIWASYSFAFKQTFIAFNQCRKLEQQLLNAVDASSNLSGLQARLRTLESSIGGLNDHNENKKESLLDLVSNFCQSNDLILRDIPKTIEQDGNDYLLETNVFTVEGPFKQINNLLYLIEYEKRISNIGSVRYFINVDQKTKRRTLQATIYLQNVKKKEHEK